MSDSQTGCNSWTIHSQNLFFSWLGFLCSFQGNVSHNSCFVFTAQKGGGGWNNIHLLITIANNAIYSPRLSPPKNNHNITPKSENKCISFVGILPISYLGLCISIRLALLLNLMFFPFPLQNTLSSASSFHLWQGYSMKGPWMLCFVNFLLSAVLLFAKRIMQIFKLSKHVYPVQLHHVRMQQALRNDLPVFHMQWNVTLEITNICGRKLQQLKNMHVIYPSLGGTWYIHLVPPKGRTPRSR